MPAQDSQQTPYGRVQPRADRPTAEAIGRASSSDGAVARREARRAFPFCELLYLAEMEAAGRWTDRYIRYVRYIAIN